MNQSSTDWVFWLSGGAVGVAGLWLLYFALWKDRARGRRRCPKCWYDLSGSQSRTCSECGHASKSERKLLKTRRRWGIAFLALVTLASALMLSRASMIARGDWAFAMPTTVLIVMLPWTEDHPTTGDWRTAAFNELMLQRVGVNSTAARTPPMWDWQWRLIVKRGLDRLTMVQRAGYRPEYYVQYWSILSCALERGVLHRLGLEDRFTAMLQPPFRIQLSQPVVANRAAKFHFEGVGARMNVDWPEGIEILTLDGESLEWRQIMTPTEGEPRIFGHREQATFMIPEAYRRIELEFRFKDMIPIDTGNIAELKTLPITYRQTISAIVQEMDHVMKPSTNPELDQVVGEGFGFEFTHVGPQRAAAIRVRLSKECVVAIPEFGTYFGRATLLRNGETLFTDSKRFDITFDERGPWGTAIATYRLSDEAAARVEEARRGEDAAEWLLRFELDEDQMLLWTVRPGMTYWDGVIEQKIDWAEHAQSN
jgi:hypothetical protein